MSFKDAIKSSVYSSFTGDALQVHEIIIILLVALLVGAYIFLVYKSTSKAAFYSKDLNITMAGMPIVVAAIMIAMQSNLVVSLGMVGALSIVRFRSAVKNPLDLLYLFWAISCGIIVGVNLLLLAVVLCAVMTIFLIVLEKIPNARAAELLVLRGNLHSADYTNLYTILKEESKGYQEKSRSIRNGESEVIIELHPKDTEKMIARLTEMNVFTQVNLIAHDGQSRV